MLSLSLLFKRFLKIGATAYGGPAIGGQMKKAIVNELAWMKEPEFMQGLALCQLIPGATFVQLSTYIGYRLRGIWGAFVCAIAFVLPAFVLLLILSTIYFKLGNLWFIQSLFKGLGAIVVAILLNAFINFGKPILKDWKAVLIAVLSFFGLPSPLEYCPGFRPGGGIGPSPSTGDGLRKTRFPSFSRKDT